MIGRDISTATREEATMPDATLVQPSEIIECSRTCHEFEQADMPGAGWSFEIDETGERVNRNPAADANYARCIAGVTESGTAIIDRGIQTYRWTYRQPAVYACACGEEFEAGYDHACACGRVYNGFGQALDPHALECSLYAQGIDCMCGEGE